MIERSFVRKIRIVGVESGLEYSASSHSSQNLGHLANSFVLLRVP